PMVAGVRRSTLLVWMGWRAPQLRRVMRPGEDEAFRRRKVVRNMLRHAIKAGMTWEDSTGA
ncbi:MAG: hypothetical protein ACK4NU_03870, partial [Brevundimonas sp.]